MSEGARVDTFQVDDGLRLLRRCWRPSTARRAVLIVHGLAEHSERYEWVARWLAQREYAVHAYDQRGHGESEGPRNHAPSFAALLDDLEAFLTCVRREEPDLPLILLGHSMGGLVVAGLLCERSPRVAAAVLTGPALAPASPIGRVALAGARAVARLLPWLRFETGIDPRGLTHDRAIVDAYVNDPRIDLRVSLRLITELLWTAPRVAARAARIEVPVWIAHGEADRLCRVEGSRAFHAGLAVPGAELRTYPGLLHEILNEPERGSILAEMHRWIEKRVPMGPPA